MSRRIDDSKPPTYVSVEQRQLLDLISDWESTVSRLRSVVAARELKLSEAEGDLAVAQAHLNTLEGQLKALRQSAVEAFEARKEGLSVYGRLPGVPDSAVEPGDFVN